MTETLEISEVFMNMAGLIYYRVYPRVCILQWSEKSRARWLVTGLLHVCSLLLVILTAPFSLFFSLKRCQEYERAVVLGSTLERVSKDNEINIAKSPSPSTVHVLCITAFVQL